MLAAGLASWVSKWRKLDVETTRTNVIAAVSSAYAGLFSSPFALLMMILESSHMQTVLYYGTLLISGLAAAIGFSLFLGRWRHLLQPVRALCSHHLTI